MFPDKNWENSGICGSLRLIPDEKSVEFVIQLLFKKAPYK